MTDEKNQVEPTEPTPESLEEMPEVDFSGAIRPNRYASLRGDFKHAVFLDDDLWQLFGSEERVLAALRLLAEIAKRETRSVA
jgi:hypothetical protein